MKPLFVSLFLMVPLAGFSQPDRRTVGGVTVDLQPIYEWKQTKQGERPMQHWKDVFLVSIDQDIFGGKECTVTIEGATRHVVIMHLPKSLVSLDAKQKGMAKQIKDLERKVSEQKNYAADASDEARARVFNDDGSWKEAHQESVQAQSDLRHLQNNLTKLQAEFTQGEARLNSMRELLAMDTGRVISGKPIWDHGQTF